MAEFENQQEEALSISSELAACLIALGVDWNDPAALRGLAREALAFKPDAQNLDLKSADIQQHAKLKFYGLVGLMLKTMEEGADRGFEVHGNDVWKAVARALWAEKGDAA